jgi:succinate dehydrogenase hydrophobic anchor subunit
LAIPVLLVGAYLTDAEARPIPDVDRPFIEAGLLDVHDRGPGKYRITLDPDNGTQTFLVRNSANASWSFTAKVTIRGGEGAGTDDLKGRLPALGERRIWVAVPGDAESAHVDLTWNDSLLEFGDPLLVVGMRYVGLFKDAGVLTHPTFIAGWVGMLVTGINLLPAGQLDGGHVARAVLGERMKYAAYLSVGALVLLTVFFQVWLLMALFILFMGIQHPPPLNDRSKLDARRKVLAALVLVVFVLTFVPRPIIL